MKNTIIKIALVMASVAVVLGIGIIIGININSNKGPEPKYQPVELPSWRLERGAEGEMIYDNFWNYARASYILIGTIPDCSFYKIVKEVPRHNYTIQNIYPDDDTGLKYYHDDAGNRQSKVVIDVSSYQENIDWETVKAMGVSGVMIRVGYRGYGEQGKLQVDEKFAQYATAAREAGLDVGVYFFSQALNYEEGVQEAQFVLDIIREYDITYPVAIDSEDLQAEGARTLNLDVASRTDSVVGFCETIKVAGYEPMIYSNRNWFAQSLDMKRLGGYKLWMANYAEYPDFPYNYSGWQYTGEGSLSGVSGYVDLNVWFD